MSEAKPTSGPWWLDEYGNLRCGVPVYRDRVLITGISMPTGNSKDYEEAKANRDLLFEAGTVFHTTGLTPSQLVERVKELEEALRQILQAPKDTMSDGKALKDIVRKASAALSKARPNTAEGEAAQQAPAAERENLELRRMLCIAHAGAAAYMDDGEAQDNRELPLIDFLHDTPAEIQDKLQRRALKKLAMTTEATTARWPSYEVAVSDPVFQVARSIMGTENMGQDRQLVAAINHVLAAAPTPAAAKEPSP